MPVQPETETPVQIFQRLLESCEQLCKRSRANISEFPPRDDSFLARSLQDALHQLELILRVIEEEASPNADRGESKGLLARLTLGLINGGIDEERGEHSNPNLSLSQQGLEGNSWTIPLPELIGFLAFGRKTGVLWVDSPNENFMIGLNQGSLVHATSDHTPEGLRLGEILVGYGFLTRRQLERFLVNHSDEVEISGETLLQTGMICDEELHAALCHQVQMLFHRLVGTKNAIFRFREGMQVPLAFQVQLNTTQLLLESARHHDEHQRALDNAQETTDWLALNEGVLGELSTLAAALPADAAEATTAEVSESLSFLDESENPVKDAKASKAGEEPAAALPADDKAQAREKAVEHAEKVSETKNESKKDRGSNSGKHHGRDKRHGKNRR